MNRASITVLLVIAIATLVISPLNSAQASDSTTKYTYTWTTKTPLPTAIFRLGAAVVDGKIYAIGGYNQRWEVQDTNYMYDPATDKWTAMAAIPTPRALFGITVYQNKIYVLGGLTLAQDLLGIDNLQINKLTAVNEVYDPATNSWETKQAMPTENFALQANVVGQKIYLNAPYSNATEVYDPASDTWSTAPPMPNLQTGFTSAVVGNKIYIIGNQTQIFDTQTRQWTLGSPPSYSVDHGAAATIIHNTTALICLFKDNFTQIYNPVNDTWTLGASMPRNREDLAVAAANDTIYAIGGTSSTGDALATNEQYISADNTATDQTNATTQPTPLNIITIATAAVIITAVAIIYTKKTLQTTAKVG
ncbi:MAG: Kelch repeat-containing protein [Candidatus Bathyarchaeia archaeon]|jgi:N-acetylneuraminic acid mutarotase